MRIKMPCYLVHIELHIVNSVVIEIRDEKSETNRTGTSLTAELNPILKAIRTSCRTERTDSDSDALRSSLIGSDNLNQLNSTVMHEYFTSIYRQRHCNKHPTC